MAATVRITRGPSPSSPTSLLIPSRSLGPAGCWLGTLKTQRILYAWAVPKGVGVVRWVEAATSIVGFLLQEGIRDLLAAVDRANHHQQGATCDGES